MESPAQIRRLRELALARIARHESEIAICRREIALYDELLSLHGDQNRSNIASNMQLETAGKSRSVRISAGRATVDSESRRAAVAADLTDGQIAKLTGASRQAVQKWHTGKMAIPARHAKTLAELQPKGGKQRAIPIGTWKRVGD